MEKACLNENKPKEEPPKNESNNTRILNTVLLAITAMCAVALVCKQAWESKIDNSQKVDLNDYTDRNFVKGVMCDFLPKNVTSKMPDCKTLPCVNRKRHADCWEEWCAPKQQWFTPEKQKECSALWDGTNLGKWAAKTKRKCTRACPCIPAGLRVNWCDE